MSEDSMVEVTITAEETVRYRRTMKIPSAKFEEYEAMVEQHQKKCVPDIFWEAAFGDYLRPGQDDTHEGLEDLEISLVRPNRTQEGAE